MALNLHVLIFPPPKLNWNGINKSKNFKRAKQYLRYKAVGTKYSRKESGMPHSYMKVYMPDGSIDVVAMACEEKEGNERYLQKGKDSNHKVAEPEDGSLGVLKILPTNSQSINFLTEKKDQIPNHQKAGQFQTRKTGSNKSLGGLCQKIIDKQKSYTYMPYHGETLADVACRLRRNHSSEIQPLKLSLAIRAIDAVLDVPNELSHRDVKNDNMTITLTSNNDLKIKLIDWEMCGDTDLENEKFDDILGTACKIPPADIVTHLKCYKSLDNIALSRSIYLHPRARDRYGNNAIKPFNNNHLSWTMLFDKTTMDIFQKFCPNEATLLKDMSLSESKDEQTYKKENLIKIKNGLKKCQLMIQKEKLADRIIRNNNKIERLEKSWWRRRFTWRSIKEYQRKNYVLEDIRKLLKKEIIKLQAPNQADENTTTMITTKIGKCVDDVASIWLGTRAQEGDLYKGTKELIENDDNNLQKQLQGFKKAARSVNCFAKFGFGTTQTQSLLEETENLITQQNTP